MNIILIVLLTFFIILSCIVSYLYVKSVRKYKDTNFTPFFMGRITPFTVANEASLANNKSALELVIQFLEHKLHAKVSELVELHESDKHANICRGEVNMLRTLRTEFTSLKNKKLKEQ